jgi:hypothetical protein
MHAVDARKSFDFESLGTFPGMALDPGHALTALVARLTGSNTTSNVSYATKGGLYQEAGIPTIICIAQTHQADEFVTQGGTRCLRCLHLRACGLARHMSEGSLRLRIIEDYAVTNALPKLGPQVALTHDNERADTRALYTSARALVALIGNFNALHKAVRLASRGRQ